MKSPRVTVGILSGHTIHFALHGSYITSDGEYTSGKQEVSLSGSGMSFLWKDRLYHTLEFTPASYKDSSFELAGVTIGVDFHWERKENQRFRGALRFIISCGQLAAVNIIDVEDYLVSVISSEMKATSSLALLQAHAVISRSWLLAQMKHRTKPQYAESHVRASNIGETIKWWDHDDHQDYDVCADDHCQRYQGIARVNGNTAAEAVSGTCGVVLMWNGELCDARFSKCCGGAMERFESCWDDTEHPYLAPGRDTGDDAALPDLTNEQEAREWILSRPEAFCETSDERILSQALNGYDLGRQDFYRWREEYTQERISHLVSTRGGIDVGDIVDLIPVQRGPSGRIVRLRIVGTGGEAVIGKELMIRRSLSESHLLSSAFVSERHFGDNDRVPESFTLYGAGWGHGVGLCQIGAAVMAERGYGYEAILRHYYPGASLNHIY